MQCHKRHHFLARLHMALSDPPKDQTPQSRKGHHHPTLEMRKLRLIKIKWLAQVYTPIKMAELRSESKRTDFKQTKSSTLLFLLPFALPIIFQRREVKAQRLACHLTSTVFLQEEDEIQRQPRHFLGCKSVFRTASNRRGRKILILWLFILMPPSQM